ncbi:MAG: gluconolactonase [Rhodoferax sp.]|nr:gluconolactonase [Rhodoferax sp.]
MDLPLTPSFEVRDPRFRALVFPNVHVETLYTGCRWAEGPAWFAAGRYLVWSDIPNDRMLRWDECSGSVSTFRQPAMNTNGHTVDLQGRLVSCEHRGRCVSRTEHDGSRTVLVAQVDGKRLNSPNDVVVKSDGSLWFTDPSYGIDSDYEGDAALGEIGGCHVYRLGADGKVARVADGFVQPNGLAFSPDERTLYIADTGATHRSDGPRHIRRFRVSDDGASLSGGDVFAECEAGLFDGFRVDTRGHLWTSAGDGVHCYAPDGSLIGKIKLPEAVANVCFGGPKLNRLFICATTSLYAVYLNARGCSHAAS